jgi:hypothetical protein
MGARRITFVLVVLFAALWAATAALAALWIEFEPRKAYPGTLVVGRTMGTGAIVGPGRAFPTYLAAVASNDLIPVGHVVVDGKGNGTLRFEVPEIDGGWYRVIMSCPQCPAYSTAGHHPAVGKLRVLGPKGDASPVGAGAQEPQDLPADVTVLVITGFLLAALVFRRSLALRHR